MLRRGLPTQKALSVLGLAWAKPNENPGKLWVWRAKANPKRPDTGRPGRLGRWNPNPNGGDTCRP